ncbi:MAG: histidine phosphatase family protein [Deinococcota bacterium]|jgi:broad specificity phosphatase PhoE|nr:histidine phosphatase family protein [Deinococcota bacterium]
MRQLTLIRHGLTAWNSSRRFQGHSDVPLSAEGRAQTRALAKRLKTEGVTAVYSSPLRRAAETARVLFPEREILFDDRLKELDFGVFEARTLEENLLHPEWAHWYGDPFGRAAPGGESYRELRERVVAWLGDLQEEGYIVAVAHSGTIQMLLAHVLGIEYPRWRKRFYLRHSSVSRVLFNEGDAVIERVNDTRHLRSESGDPFDD